MIRIIKEARDSRGVTDGSHELSEPRRSAAARRQFLVSSIAFPTIFVFSAFFEVADLTAENARIAKTQRRYEDRAPDGFGAKPLPIMKTYMRAVQHESDQ
jgi:hypothetical protein